MEQEAGGIAALGIDWKIFLAQLINFVVVFWILNKYAFKPIIKVLEERRQKVERSINDAQKIIEERDQLKVEVDKKMKEASQKAQEIITSSTKAAKEEQAQIRAQADANAAKLVAETKEQIATMKQGMKAEIVKELGTLVVNTTQKVISEDIPTETKNKISQELNKDIINER